MHFQNPEIYFSQKLLVPVSLYHGVIRKQSHPSPMQPKYFHCYMEVTYIDVLSTSAVQDVKNACNSQLHALTHWLSLN